MTSPTQVLGFTASAGHLFYEIDGTVSAAATTPEPGTLLLMAGALAAVISRRRPAVGTACPGLRSSREFFLPARLVGRQGDEGGSKRNGRPVSPHGLERIGGALKNEQSLDRSIARSLNHPIPSAYIIAPVRS